MRKSLYLSIDGWAIVEDVPAIFKRVVERLEKAVKKKKKKVAGHAPTRRADGRRLLQSKQEEKERLVSDQLFERGDGPARGYGQPFFCVGACCAFIGQPISARSAGYKLLLQDGKEGVDFASRLVLLCSIGESARAPAPTHLLTMSVRPGSESNVRSVLTECGLCVSATTRVVHTSFFLEWH